MSLSITFGTALKNSFLFAGTAFFIENLITAVQEECFGLELNKCSFVLGFPRLIRNALKWFSIFSGVSIFFWFFVFFCEISFRTAPANNICQGKFVESRKQISSCFKIDVLFGCFKVTLYKKTSSAYISCRRLSFRW